LCIDMHTKIWLISTCALILGASIEGYIVFALNRAHPFRMDQGSYGICAHLVAHNPVLRYPDFSIGDISQAPFSARVSREFVVTSPDGEFSYIYFKTWNVLDRLILDYMPPRYFMVNGTEYKLEYLNKEDGTKLPDDVLFISIER
jgi:hypothetical protein